MCLVDDKGNRRDCNSCTCTTSDNPTHKWATDGLSKWCTRCGLGDDA